MSGPDESRGERSAAAPGPAVKICGVRDPEIAAWAAESGADYIGVVLAPSPRRVDLSRAGEIVSAARDRASGVGVFVDAAADDVLAARDAAGFAIAQLHGDEDPGLCARLREHGLPVWKAIRPRDREELLALWARYATCADGILVEGYSARRRGGTGSAFPHAWLDGVRRESPETPLLILAGGLDAESVRTAVERAVPDVVDVSSGVESEPGVKSKALVASFIRRARERRDEASVEADRGGAPRGSDGRDSPPAGRAGTPRAGRS